MFKNLKGCGCGSVLLGALFILLVLTLLFGWDIEGRHYGVGCSSQGVHLIWGEQSDGEETQMEDAAQPTTGGEEVTE